MLEFAAGYGGGLDVPVGDSVRESVPRVKAVPDALLEDMSVVVLLSGYGTELPGMLGTTGIPLPELAGNEETAVPIDTTLDDEVDSVEVSG